MSDVAVTAGPPSAGTTASPGGSHRASGPTRPPPPVDVRGAAESSLPSWWTVLVGAWTSLTLAVLIGLRELDALVGQVLVDTQTYSLTGLTSTGLREAAGGWTALAGELSSTRAPLLDDWIRGYAQLDLVFVLLYGLPPLAWFVRRVVRRSSGVGWSVVGTGAMGVAMVADVVESILILGVSTGRDPAQVIVWSSATKWVGLALSLLAAITIKRFDGAPRGKSERSGYTKADTRTPVRVLGRVVRGLYTHRFSLLVVVPFAVLGLVNGSDILDQIPDVQRQWVDDEPLARLLWSGALNVLVSAVVVAVGRLRSHHSMMRVLPDAAPYRRPSLLPWLVTAAVIALGGLVSVLLDQSLAGVEGRFWVALSVPLAVLVGSWLFRRFGPQDVWSPYRRPLSPEQAATTRTVGDVLGVLVLVIPSLGLVRAFSGPVALKGDGLVRQSVDLLRHSGSLRAEDWHVLLLLVGLVAAVLTWPGAKAVGMLLGRVLPIPWLTVFTPGLVLPGKPSEDRARLGGWVLLAVGVATFVVVGLLPDLDVPVRWVIEIMLVAVMAVALPLGATVILLQGGGAPDLLSRPWTPSLRTAPVMTIIIITAVGVGLLGDNDQIHGLRNLGTDSATPTRPTLEQRLARLAGASTCASPLEVAAPGRPARTYAVRPVFVAAAEGGGIRAAAWTALGMDAMHDAGGPCARALMSSGASGGAVGLTIASFATEGDAYAAAKKIAGPQALGAAVTGLLVRDPVRSVTGIAFPTANEDGWVDRAGLMERSWEGEVQQLRKPFLRTDLDTVPGALVLNSTSVATHCRTLLSQVSLDDHADPLNCQTTSSATDSVDLLATVREGCGGEVPRLRASTVALLASRFPYVTPSGVVTSGCDDGDTISQQIVDGGYADNDGIGTVVDLSPRWLPALRTHNEAVLDGQVRGPLLVPVLVYLDNGAGSDIARAPGGEKNEILVPLLTKGAATAGLSATDAQLRRALDVFSTASVVPGCASLPASSRAAPTTDEQASGLKDRQALCAALESWRGPPVKVFYQPSRPSIAAPLGWVLSSQSLRTLECARDQQVAPVLTDVAAPCDTTTVVADEEAPSVTGDGCAGSTEAREESDLNPKGYGSMLSALCLARGARHAAPLPTAADPPE